MANYDGPCSCNGLAINNNPYITFPSANTTLIANTPIKIKWDAALNDTGRLTVSLYTYSGTCDFSGGTPAMACRFSDILTRPLVSVPNNGEAEWTPTADLESRDDYVLDADLRDGEPQMRVWSSQFFTILKKEGDEVLKLPTPEELGRSTETASSTASVSVSFAGQTSTRPLSSPTQAGMSATPTTSPTSSGGAASREGSRLGWRVLGLLVGGVVVWLG